MKIKENRSLFKKFRKNEFNLNSKEKKLIKLIRVNLIFSLSILELIFSINFVSKSVKLNFF
jgi:hypothetical protein